jgi:hypothetical protein
LRKTPFKSFFVAAGFSLRQELPGSKTQPKGCGYILLTPSWLDM